MTRDSARTVSSLQSARSCSLRRRRTDGGFQISTPLPPASLPPIPATPESAVLANRPYLCMVLGAASFAVMSTLVSIAGERCPWQLVAMVRSFLAMVFAGGWAVAAGVPLVWVRPPVLWIRSLAGSMALMSGFFSLTRLHTTEVLTLTNMFPIWVALLSWPLLGLRPERSLWLAVGCGVLGVVCMQQPQIAQGNYVWLIAFGSSFWSAIALLGLHRLGGLDTRAVVAHFSAVSMIASSLAWALWPTLTQPAAAAAAAAKPTAGPLEWSWSLVGLLLLVGVTATIGQLFLTKAFATGHPGRVSVVGLSQVGFGMLLELLFRGRNFNSLTVVGIVLVLAPTAWVMLRERRPAVPIDP